MAIWPISEAVMERRHFLTHLALSTVVVKLPSLVACAPVPPFVVAVHPRVGCEMIYFTREFNWLNDAVVLREGKILSDSFAALQSGQADAACMTLDGMLRARASGILLSVALIFDVSTGSDVVLARPDIRMPADLGGKRLGLEENALGNPILQKLLEVVGLPESSLSIVVRQAAVGVNMPGLAANRSYLLGGGLRLLNAARNLSAWMVMPGLLAEEDDLSELIMPGTLPGDEH